MTEGVIERALAGDGRALARLVSLAENGGPELRPVMKALAPLTGRARVTGLTGAPGVGKSTVTAALVGAYRAREVKVGVLAVDPTSPFSGGALLGDRVRMQDHATDPGVFIRSMASRGHLGGLAAATPQALRVLDAAGFGAVLVETVGVGQAEVEIASLADTTLVLVAPGMGDAVQAAKAGILETGDIFVVNKSDHPGAQETVRDLRTMIAMASRGAADWRPPIVSTTATAGEGIADLAAALDAHWSWRARPPPPGAGPGGGGGHRAGHAPPADGRAARRLPDRWPGRPGGRRGARSLFGRGRAGGGGVRGLTRRRAAG